MQQEEWTYFLGLIKTMHYYNEMYNTGLTGFQPSNFRITIKDDLKKTECGYLHLGLGTDDFYGRHTRTKHH